MEQIIIKTKTDLHDTITSIDSFDAILEYDPITKTFKLIVKGIFKDGGNMPKSGLTEADWQRIESLFVPINQRLTNIENRLDVLEEDMKNVKEDVKEIKECPTIKKELKK